MKRHHALAPLSRDHHHALVLAQLLKADAPAYKGLPTDLNGKVTHALRIYETQLQPHMRKEEAHLFPLCSGLAPEIDQLVYILLDDHAEIDNLFQKLQGEANQAWLMDQLAHLLEQHVRCEERELFDLIQQHADEELMMKIGEALEDGGDLSI